MNLLIARTDRLGDTILSIPVVEAIKKKYPEHKITFLTRKYCAPLFDNNKYLDELIIDENNVLKKGGSIKGFFTLLKKIKNKKFDIIIILHPEFRLNLLALLSGIKKRVVPASKIYQFMANIRISQKRSECKIHEAEYNLDLVRRIFKDIPKIYPNLIPNKLNIKNIEKYKSSSPLVIVHPGSGGSARNWSLSKYREVIKILIRNKIEVFISWGPDEKKIKDYFDDIIDNKMVKTYEKNIELEDYIALISISNLIFTSSTGPLHIGAAVNIKTISLFCPIKVCTPVRWGAYSEGNNFCFIPKNIPNCEKCIEEKCKFFDCMDKIKIEEVSNKIIETLNI